jgi:hypothetical protein
MKWNLAAIQRAIGDREQESLQLEFKSAGAIGKVPQLKKEISKDVSAFANAIGGTIVYGIAESPEEPGRAEKIDAVDAHEFSKEWLDQVISSTIQPKIPGIIIHTVRVNERGPERVVHCVTVPESTTVHQAIDHRYYKRTNGRSEPMEDYEVRLAMFRSVRPAYEIFPEHRAAQMSGGFEFLISVMVLNRSEIPGHECSLIAYTTSKPPFSPTPNYAWIEFEGKKYARLAGGGGLDLMPGQTQLGIQQGIQVGNPSESIEVMFRLYDRFGLALAELFEFHPNQFPAFLKIHSIDTGRRQAIDSP